MKTDLEQKLEKLRLDTEEFEYSKQVEIDELNEKIAADRKKYKKLNKEIKQDYVHEGNGKQEIEDLKSKIEMLKAESKSKDKANSKAMEQLKEELDTYNAQNDEIRAEIRQLEKQRIVKMQTKNSSNLKQTNDKDSKQTKPKAVVSRFEIDADNNRYKPNYNYEEDQPNYSHENYDHDENYNDSQEQVDEDFQENDDYNYNQNDDIQEEVDEDEYKMVFLSQYHNDHPDNTIPIEESIGNKNKIQRLFRNGKKELIFHNGSKKQIYPDGYTILFFSNKDIKQTYPDGKSVYYFSEADTTQTTLLDGTKIFRFGNGQIETHFTDGRININVDHLIR